MIKSGSSHSTKTTEQKKVDIHYCEYDTICLKMTDAQTLILVDNRFTFIPYKYLINTTVRHLNLDSKK